VTVRSVVILSAATPYPRDSGKSVVLAGFLDHFRRSVPETQIHYLHVGRPLGDLTDFGDIVVHELGRRRRHELIANLLFGLPLKGLSLQEAFTASRSVQARLRTVLATLDADLEIVDTIRMSQLTEDLPHRGRRVLYLDDLFSERYRRMLAVLDDDDVGSHFDPLGQFTVHVPGPLRGLTRRRHFRRGLLLMERLLVARREVRAVGRVELSLLLNRREAATLHERSGAAVMAIPPLIAPPAGRETQWSGRPEYCFVGMLSIAHNDDGLSWFLRDGMPELLRVHPDAVLHIIGRGASPHVVALAETYGDNVRLHGYVQDLDALVGSCCAMVNVLRFGSGVKIKVLDALARGLPVVTTEVGAEGIGESSPGLLITGSAAEAGLALARLTDRAARAAAVRDATRIYTERYAPQVAHAAYDAAFGTAVATASHPASGSATTSRSGSSRPAR
jgi:glycosyltransferase involved in cell wall biosynthesis